MRNTVSDILPVVVLYCTPLEETAVYRTLLSSGAFRRFMVYDNSPAEYLQHPVPDTAEYVRDARNSGLSKAYNTAAEYARTHGFSRVLLLDQDTQFPADAVACYAAADRYCSFWAPAVKTQKGAPLSPTVNTLTGVRAITLQPGLHSLRRHYVINSGMCVDVYAFCAAGGYNEAVRLDFADFQFLERLKQVDSRLLLLPFVAIQDFSNEVVDEAQLFRRFTLYVQSFKACCFNNRRTRLRHGLGVLKHTLNLTARTRKTVFIKYLFSELFIK